MAASRRSLQQVREVITTAHEDCTPAQKLQFYDRWAQEYEEDVSVLEYNAPRLAAAVLASGCISNRESKLVLDVACGTGLVAQELLRCGFRLFHGLDGSSRMMEMAQTKKLYQELKQCMLGQEPLPSTSGGLLCLTTRSNTSNLQYKAELEHELAALQSLGLCDCITTQNIEKWEKATSKQEVQGESDYISGVIYLYKKMETIS
ncbi:methyltransferase-like protein 27 isoform X2 [Pelobates fuscus]|uniref:methyltransferase-like protein 27 isoform X2 n=1 Tax=Pelobates fuscus TaxID=191477 RepID=UPI002FE4C05E